MVSGFWIAHINIGKIGYLKVFLSCFQLIV